MAEQNTPVMDPAPIHTPAPQPSGKAPERKKKNRKIIKNIITAIIVLAVIAAVNRYPQILPVHAVHHQRC